MKKFLPLIIVILIAIIFSILALYTSNILTSGLKVVEGNTGGTPVDCEFTWSEWSTCNNSKRTRSTTITRHPQNGGEACPTSPQEQDCATSSGTINSATECKQPDNLTGYEFDSENRVKTTFEIGGLKCAKDYYGNPTSEACASTGTPYSLKGCHRIVIEATNADTRILAVNFSKPITVIGSPGDLKNNFKYMVVSIDDDFKKVSDAFIISNNQIQTVNQFYMRT